jgi:hypothetical protein
MSWGGTLIMRKLLSAVGAALVLAAAMAAPAAAAKPDDFDAKGNVLHSVADTGFDDFGYNDVARIFSGKADGVDRNLDGTVWGDPTYANDLLVMKWNAEWDRGNAEKWTDPPYAAWETNEWNGMAPGGSGAVWHYKIQWVGPCGADGTGLPDGGYCLWGQFEVLMDQGLDPAFGPGHIFGAHALPNGFGN